jgi:hypothetical protein
MGAPGSIDTVQIKTNLNSAWVSLFTSNSVIATFDYLDLQATDSIRF